MPRRRRTTRRKRVRTGQYRGRGDYKSVLRNIGKYGSRAIGAAAGAMPGYMQGGLSGGLAGGRTGWEQGADFSRYMGWGDYASVNQIMQQGGSGAQQQISVNRHSRTGDVYITHTEFVQNVVASGTGGSSSAFEIREFPINPAISTTFPFLSQLAENYILYQMEGCLFQYKPTSGEYGSNNSNALGKVIMCTQYDPEAPAYQNAVEMENYDYANSTKPSKGAIHGVETASSQKAIEMHYTRTGASSKSKLFTDLGTFYLATEGVPFGGAGAQTALIGELWVTYKVKLSRASLYGSLLGKNVHQDLFTGSCTAAAALATGPVAKSTNQIGCTITQNVLNPATQLDLAFPVNISLGYFRVRMYMEAPPFVFTNGEVFNLPVNGEFLTYYDDANPPQAAALVMSAPGTVNVGGACEHQWMEFGVKIEAPGINIAKVTLRWNGGVAANWVIRVFEDNGYAAEAIA